MASQLGFWVFMEDQKPHMKANRNACRTLQDRAFYRRSNSSVLVQQSDDGVTLVRNYFTKNIRKLPAFEPEVAGCSRCLRQGRN